MWLTEYFPPERCIPLDSGDSDTRSSYRPLYVSYIPLKQKSKSITSLNCACGYAGVDFSAFAPPAPPPAAGGAAGSGASSGNETTVAPTTVAPTTTAPVDAPLPPGVPVTQCAEECMNVADYSTDRPDGEKCRFSFHRG